MDVADLRLADVKEPLPEHITERLRREIFQDVNLYPRNYDTLISRLAQRHNAGKDNITLVNGAAEGIDLVARSFGQDTLIFSPTYYEYYNAVRRNGLKSRMINCFDGRGFSLDWSQEDIEGRSLVFLCNPNNPFGILQRDEITGIAEKASGIVAVDETYIDFDGESVVSDMAGSENMLVLRSFSKGYSLAGFRIGYIIAPRRLKEEIERKKVFCNVSSVSVNAAMIALDEEKYFRGVVEKTKKSKGSMEEFMDRMGFGVIHTHTNCIMLKFRTPEEASAFREFLESRGILVNQGGGISICGLDDTFIRMSCGTGEQMEMLRSAVSEYRRAGSSEKVF